MKYAICVGINDYSWLSPESCLHGCVTDARDWAQLFLDCYVVLPIAIPCREEPRMS